MEDTKTNFNWKRLLITLSLVLFTAGAVGGGVYYVLDSNFKKERTDNEKALNDLQEQVKTLKAEDKAEITTSTAGKTTTITDETSTWKTFTDPAYNYSFKYPSNLTVKASGANGPTYHAIAISKAGGNTGDVDDAFLQVNDKASITNWTDATINSPSGAILGRYEKSSTPMGYTYYAFEFQHGGKYYYFRWNDSGLKVFASLEEFKKMVDTITFK